ncbi:hypothetical protein C1646_691261 [Rhizophagus diaphanus]|nr:hypothetical protein C1646_691261 [Rhizophagus diaphanus] [Rhizophagus sp. MUCL 43196]
MKKYLPIEILQKIFCSQLDILTLYNCLLVNRLWCKTVVPLLWQNPFSHFDKNKIQRWKYKSSLINTYVTCLDSNAKNYLKNSDVILPEEINKRSTFNYETFLQSLDYTLLFQSTGNWIGEVENCTLRKLTLRHYLLVEELCKLFFSSSRNLKELIYDKPHSLPHVQELRYIPLKYLGAEQSMSKLVSFKVYDLIPNEIIISLSQISHHLSEIQIETTGDNDDALASLISVQKSLKKLVICSEDNLPKLSDVLRKNLSLSLTHVEINWEFCVPFDIFCNCSDTLEYFSVQQYYSGLISRSTFHQFSNTQFKKLHTLKIITPKLYLDQISTLIRNTKDTLKYIHLDYEKISIESSVELINSISRCSQLNTLEIFVPDDSISCIVNLLSSCKKLQKISFLTGDSLNDLDTYTVDISDILPKIGKILPNNLSTFYLSHNWITTANSLRDFLKECEKNFKKRGEKKLDFRIIKELSAEHIDVIEEFGKRGILDLENTALGKNLQFYRQQFEWKLARNIIVNKRKAHLNNFSELI